MPRPGRMSNEKANDFGGAMKRLFRNMKKWRILMIIAIVLAAASSIFSIIAPNKLSDITDAITNGITPNAVKIQEITEIMTSNFNNQEKMALKMQEIMMSDDVQSDDKQVFQETMLAMQTATEEEKTKYFMTLPDSVLLKLFDEIQIDGITISKEDQLNTTKVLLKVDANDADSTLKAFDELPNSVYELVKPQMDMNYIKEIALFLLILYIVGALFGYIQHFMLSTVSNRFAQNLRSRISTKINKLPLRYFDVHETGDVLSRVTNDIDAIAQHLNNSLGSLVSAITLFIGCIVMMFYTNWIMAITAIFASILGFVLMFAILRKITKIFQSKTS